jgi:large subunit ribosomal protein L18
VKQLSKSINRNLRQRLRRKMRTRAKTNGTVARPRLVVYRSNRHVYVQVVDDLAGHTLVATSTLMPEIRSGLEGGLKERAKKIGTEIARLCKEKGIEKVVFDRNGFIYRKGGRIDAVAAGAREGGLDF